MFLLKDLQTYMDTQYIRQKQNLRNTNQAENPYLVMPTFTLQQSLNSLTELSG